MDEHPGAGGGGGMAAAPRPQQPPPQAGGNMNLQSGGGCVGVGAGGGGGQQPQPQGPAAPAGQEAAGPAELSRPQHYTIPGILHYIQHEWARFEMERAHWEVERAELQYSPHGGKTIKECRTWNYIKLHVKTGTGNTWIALSFMYGILYGHGHSLTATKFEVDDPIVLLLEEEKPKKVP